ncbi:trypsin-like serine protease [Natranaeroarchaeum aerophilus]|uniref:S1 family peptidase n=1 Tax=Natranaeroarchaeum aerophilus TaxID=2917711 RepID=A0AAE3FPN6_9EURY|nr:trypsin-like serine protease [Natranaeroarchaeum aerophilus]MCL9812949.1 S1 family peptidase [Natranaeroarchaeum aerophilus]
MDSSKLSRMGRRRFVETLTLAGVSTQTATAISPEKLKELTDDPSERVPIHKGKEIDRDKLNKDGTLDGLPQVKDKFVTVSRDEWTVVESAKDAAKRVNGKINELDDSGLITAGVTIDTSGHHRQHTVKVTYTEKESKLTNRENADREYVHKPDIEFDELRNNIPNKIDGIAGNPSGMSETVEDIPVLVEKTQKTPEEDDITTNCGEKSWWRKYYDDDYRPVPAGVDQNISDHSGGGTLGYPVTYDGNRAFVTNAHVTHDTDDEDEDDAIGRLSRQPVEAIGEVVEANYEPNGSRHDIGIIEIYDDFTRSYSLANDDGGYGELIDGTISWSYLHYLQSNKDDVYKQGVTTGRCSGRIMELRTDGHGAKEVIIRATAEDGDSGGPYFIPDCNNVKIIGIHKASTDYNAYGLHHSRLDHTLPGEISLF